MTELICGCKSCQKIANEAIVRKAIRDYKVWDEKDQNES